MVFERSRRALLSCLLVAFAASSSPATATQYDFSLTPAHPSAAQKSNPKKAFHTDEFTGSFGYRIPIEVPPGRPGATPDIALGYGSGGSNGWLGVGWNLDVGYIQRDGRDGVPILWPSSGTLPYEPVSPLQYDDDAGFVFSFRGHSSRLTPIGSGVYRAELDKEALKFVLSPSGWTVYAKDGSVHQFGFTSESAYSRMEMPVWESTAVGNAKTFRWALSSSEDANGNRILYEYADPITTQRQLYLSRIRYNGHTSQQASAYTHTIDFGLEDRRDAFGALRDTPLSFRFGYRVETSKRLHTITTSVSGVRARQYVLEYTHSPSTGRSLLSQVKEYGELGSGLAHPPIELSYQVQSLSFAPKSTWGSSAGTLLHQAGTNPPTSGSRPWNALTYTTKSESNGIGSRVMLEFLDMDRDGLPDRVLTDQVYDVGAGQTPPDHYLVQHNTAQQSAGLDDVLENYPFDSWPGQGGPAAMRGSLGWTGTSMCDLNDNGKSYLKLIDLNGDGYQDRVHDWKRVYTTPTIAQALNFYVEYGGPDGFASLVACGPIENHGNPQGLAPPLMSDLAYAYSPWNSPQYSMQDCNMTGGPSCGASGGSCIPNNPVGALVATLMDVNGDGLPDRVLRLGNDQLTTRDHFRVQLNRLDAQGHASLGPLMRWDFDNQYVVDQYFWNNPFTFESGTSPNTNTPVGLFDVNGDGLPDRLMRKSGACSGNPASYYDNFVVQYGNGHGFEEGQPAEYFGPLELPAGVSGVSSCSYASPSSSDDFGVTGGNRCSATIAMLQDVNADGLVDRLIHDVVLDGSGGWIANSWVQPNEGGRFGSAQPISGMDTLPGSFLCNSQYPGPYQYPQAGMPHPWPCEPQVFEAGNTSHVQFRDVNGDGLPDRIMANPNYSADGGFFVQLAEGDVPDLLCCVENGLGASISVEYAPSTSWVNRDIDIAAGQTPWQAGAESLLSSVIQTVSSVTVDDGIGPAATTTYAYFGGMYDYVDREFRGFHRTTTTDPSGAYTTKWFHQDGGMDHTVLGEWQDTASNSKRGMPFRIESFDDQGNLYQLVVHKVEEIELSLDPGRWFPYVSSTATLNYEGLATPRATVELFEYYDLGIFETNLYRQVSLGEVLGFNVASHAFATNRVPEDDREMVYTYVNSPSNPELRDRVDFEHFRDWTGSVERLINHDYDPITGNETAVYRLKEDWPSQVWIAESFTYDVYGNQLTHTRPAGGSLSHPTGLGEVITRRTEWDTLYHAFPTLVVEDDGALGLQFETANTYDALSGQLLTTEDLNSVVTRNVYDNLHRLKEVWLDLPGGTTIWQSVHDYQFDGVLSGVSQNRVPRVINDASDPSQTLGTGPETYTYSDGLGRLVQARVEAEDGATTDRFRVSDTRYDTRGNVSKTTRDYFSTGSGFTSLGSQPFTLVEYDALGRPTRLTPPVGDIGSPTGVQTTEYSYGQDPWARVIKDGRKNTTGTGVEKREYRDAFGRIESIEEVLSGTTVFTTRYTYDNFDQLLEIEDHKLNKTRYGYDMLGRRVTTVDPDLVNQVLGGQLVTTYFDDGSVESQTDGMGQRREFLYDHLGRVVRSETFAGGSSTAEEVFEYFYDANTDGTASQFPVFKGQLYKVVDSEGSERHGYDVRGHVLRSRRHVSKTAKSYTTESAYDVAGRLVGMTFPGGEAGLRYVYDNAGNLRRIRATSGTGPSNELFYDAQEFDELRQPTRVACGNGVTNHLTYYPGSKRLQSIRAQKAGQADYLNLTYTYDAANNVTSITDGVGAHAALASGTRANIQYDELNRLVSYQRPTGPGLQTFGFSYDAIGNMLSNADAGPGNYTYPTSGHISIRPHAVTQSPLGSYIYDDGGRMTTRGPSGAVQLLEYSARNLLTRVTAPQTGSVVDFGYDHDGERLWKESASGTTVWIGPHFEVRDSRSLCHVIADGKRICTFEPIEPQRELPGQLTSQAGAPPAPDQVFDYYHQDQLASSSVVTNRDGSLAQEYQYSAYGSELHLANGAEYPLYNRFTDQYWDEEVGLYYYGARYYDPALGRFIQADTLTPDVYNPQGLNRYTYVLNNPFRYVDPTGQSWWDSVKNAVKGAVLGDFAGEDLGTAGAVGQFLGGLTPLGVLADVRDFAATGMKVMKGEAGLGDLAMAGAGLIPGVSEARKLANAIGGAGAAVGKAVGRGLSKASDLAAATSRRVPTGLCFVAGMQVATPQGSIPIECLTVGDRVLTTDGASYDESSRVDSTCWKRIRLQMPNPEFAADLLEIEVLRSPKWLEVFGVDAGREVFLELDEMGLEGTATVLDIQPCPELPPGPGHVVLATIAHANGNVRRLNLANGEAIELTGRHRLFSASRAEWVQASQLVEGELLRTQGEPVQISTIEWLPEVHRVYNLEVETEHCFFVGSARVLAHNQSCARDVGGGAARGGRSVLGHYPGYINKASELGARRFNVPANVWEKMTDAERWTANQKFLDRLIKRGDEVILSTPADQARAESFFARELEYLQGQGYRLVDGGTRLVPGQ